MNRRFQRTVESFTCEHCGAEVSGDGYTNHCPKCLWSKHVDKNPGDRAEGCHGVMEPIEIVVKGTEYTIVHECQRCLTQRRIKSSKDDDFEMLLSIVQARRR